MQLPKPSTPSTGHQRFFFVRAHEWWRTLMSPTNNAPSRVLRWVFRRDFDTLACELAFVGESRFELSLDPAYFELCAEVEQYSQISSALQRQCEIEARLLDEGWTLELHESKLA